MTDLRLREKFREATCYPDPLRREWLKWRDKRRRSPSDEMEKAFDAFEQFADAEDRLLDAQGEPRGMWSEPVMMSAAIRLR